MKNRIKNTIDNVDWRRRFINRLFVKKRTQSEF